MTGWRTGWQWWLWVVVLVANACCVVCGNAPLPVGVLHSFCVGLLLGVGPPR
ncbi:MAG: hypothetical protein AB7P16_22500 [Bradyrhizobium sp.]